MNKLATLASRYTAILVSILAGWMLAILSNAPNLGALLSDASVKSLVMLVVPWLGGCALHYVSTGDPNPVLPALKQEPKRGMPPEPPTR